MLANWYWKSQNADSSICRFVSRLISNWNLKQNLNHRVTHHFRRKSNVHYSTSYWNDEFAQRTLYQWQSRSPGNFNCRLVDFDKNVLTINLESTMGIVLLQNASNFVNWRVSTWRNSRWVLIRAILCDSLLEAKSQFCSKSKCRFLTCTIHRPIGTHYFEISYWWIIHSCPCDNKVQPTQRHFYCSFHFHLPYKIWKSWFSSCSRKFCQIRSS